MLPVMPTTPKRQPASAAGTEARLHAASVQAGAGAAIDVALHTLPLLRPFIPKRMLDAAEAMKPNTVRRELVQTIYRRHGLKPARWELESVLAVAQTQAKLSPLTRTNGLRDLLGAWLPAPLGEALDIAPAKLRDFSAEALTLALPPLKLAAAWGGQMLRASGRIAKAAGKAASATGEARAAKAPARSSKATSKPTAKKTAAAKKRSPAKNRAPSKTAR